MQVIREAVLEDCQALLSIENSAFSSDLISPRQMRYLLTQAKAASYVAQFNEQVIGYAIILTPDKKTVARIYSLAVNVENRGQGIAQQLLATMLAMAKTSGYLSVQLEVRCADQAVIRLYEKVGFNITATLADYYEDGADAYKMRMQLSAYLSHKKSRSTRPL